MSCEKCGLLMELFERTPLTKRDYWVMTELFVLLHEGKDDCRVQSFTPKVNEAVFKKARAQIHELYQGDQFDFQTMCTLFDSLVEIEEKGV